MSVNYDAHLQKLNQLESTDLAVLYQGLTAGGPWPHIDDEPLDPMALIAYSVIRLVSKLAPPEQKVMSFAEVHLVAQALGHIASQFDAIVTIVKVAMCPGRPKTEYLAGAQEGMQLVAEDIAAVIGLELHEEEDGEETQAAQ